MNLDDTSSFASLDPEGMLDHINSLPDQLRFAWNLGKKQPLPSLSGIQSILIAGMGGSAIGADLLASYAAPLCPVPIFVHRDYDLPAWAKGSHTLVILSSHSGNTEETLSAFAKAQANGCQILSISTGGKLAELSKAANIPLWIFEHHGQPRSAVGYSFGLILAALTRLGLLPDPENDVLKTFETMRDQQAIIGVASPVDKNPAKRLANQLVDHMVAVIGSGYLAPVARRWKGQISEVAKSWGQFEALPEVDHNTLAGLVYPSQILKQTYGVFLRAPSDHPRNQLRAELTRKTFVMEGVNADFVDAAGDNPMAHIWSTLHFGDYTAYYMAMLYGVDPTPIPTIEGFKKEMKKAGA